METTTPTIKPLANSSRMNQDVARDRMTAYIEKHRAAAVHTMTQIRDVVPTDKIVPAQLIDFAIADGQNGSRLEYLAPGVGREGLHRNALSQLAGRLDIPMAYVDHLVASAEKDGDKVNRWGLNFLARTLREHAVHTEDRYLVRSVAGEARAFLSDKFRRIDCRPGALTLLETAQKNGLIVANGTFTDTRSSLKFILPQTFEVFPGEYMVFGFDWSNSDYGRGASDLRMFLNRLACWNGATVESVIRQVHIGRRLSDDIEYAQDTLEADAKASALVLRDAAAMATSPARVQRMIAGIQAANETKIDPKARVESLRKQLTKGEAELVVQAFNAPDVENMPAGNTLWRWSNAISWVGGQDNIDPDRKLDFERLAGEVLKPAMPKADDAAAAA